MQFSQTSLFSDGVVSASKLQRFLQHTLAEIAVVGANSPMGQCAMDPSVGRQVQKTTALQRMAAECGFTSTACRHCMLFAARLLATNVQVANKSEQYLAAGGAWLADTLADQECIEQDC